MEDDEIWEAFDRWEASHPPTCLITGAGECYGHCCYRPTSPTLTIRKLAELAKYGTIPPLDENEPSLRHVV